MLPTAVRHALQAANITFSLHPSHSVDPAQQALQRVLDAEQALRQLAAQFNQA